MYLMYVDECGDVGMGAGSSGYFILSALVVHESMWFTFLSRLAEELAGLSLKYGMAQGLEIHAKAMLGRSEKQYSSMSKLKRLMLLRDLLRFEATQGDAVRSINVVVDKRDKPFGFDAFTCAWDTLVNRFENTIRHDNFPIVAAGASPAVPEHGIIISDKTDEKKLRGLIRRMRHANIVPSGIVPGASYQSNLALVIEDAMHKDSQHSQPIQLCDTNAYFLRQMLEPNSTIRKHDAQNYFFTLRPILLTEACKKNELGVVFR